MSDQLEFYSFFLMAIDSTEVALCCHSPFKLRACTYDATSGIGVFTVLPLAPNKRAKAAEDAKLGVRYASANFTVGTTVSPLQWLGAPSNLWVPSAVWMAGKAGPITAGVQFKSAGMNYLMLVNL
jgi:hypothetical protein